MSRSGTMAALKIWAGALAAPVLWFVQQQLVYWRLPEPCGGLSWLTLAIWLACALLLAGACGVSARQIRMARGDISDARRLFAIGLAVVMPLLFLVPMSWQALGGLLYSGCER
jgi:hypothetical protein